MKIIGSDYDGTLNHGGFPAEKLEAIKKWQAAGNRFGVISGRNHDFLKELPEKTGIDFDFLIAYNGGMIFTPGGEIIHENMCTDVEIAPFIRQLFAWGCDFAHMCGEKYYRIWRCSELREEGGWLLEETPEFDSFYQISVQLPTEEEAAQVVKLAAEKYGDRLNPLLNGVCIDIVPKGVNKAVGLENVCRHYGAKHEDVIAVGDNLNDMDMIRAFRSYAMESGAEALKKEADFTIKSIEALIEKEI